MRVAAWHRRSNRFRNERRETETLRHFSRSEFPILNHLCTLILETEKLTNGSTGAVSNCLLSNKFVTMVLVLGIK